MPTQLSDPVPAEPTATLPKRERRSTSLFEPAIVRRAIGDAFKKLNPRSEARNPIMFVVLVGAVWTSILFFLDLSSATAATSVFGGLVALWLWFTVLFANFAEALAEGRGKAQADTLRRTRSETVAHVRLPDGSIVDRASSDLTIGDEVVCNPGDLIPGDGDVIEGIASVDESAITGESAPVIRESGGDRSAVTGGTRVLSDGIVVKITTKPGESFIDRMIALVEGADRQKTPNEIALNILLAGLTIAFLLAVTTLQPFAVFSNAHQSIIVLVGLLVCLAPTTIGALLSAIGIAGMDRLVQRNVLAMSATFRPYCSTRPARSPTETGWHRSSSPSAANRSAPSPRWSCWPPSRMRHRKDARSSSSPKSATASPRWRCSEPSSSPSPRRPGCRASNGKDGRSVRARATPSNAG